MRLEIKSLGAWALCLALGVSSAAQAVTKRTTRKPATAKKTVSTSSKKSSSARTVSSRRHNSRPAPFRYRLAHLQISSDRISEIQLALTKSGYYQGEPTGKWDEPTKAAMRQCQAANGFPATGLPDSKSLMKLGLGPHPLPLELDATAQSRVNVEAAPKEVSPSSLSSPEKSQQPNNPM